MSPRFAHGQCIEFGAGLMINGLNSYEKENGHDRSSFTARGGFAIHTGISEMANDSFPVDFSLHIIQYEGEFLEASGGLGGGNNTRGELDK